MSQGQLGCWAGVFLAAVGGTVGTQLRRSQACLRPLSFPECSRYNAAQVPPQYKVGGQDGRQPAVCKGSSALTTDAQPSSHLAAHAPLPAARFGCRAGLPLCTRVPPHLKQGVIQVDPASMTYSPHVWFNDFWLLREHLVRPAIGGRGRAGGM